MSKLRSVVGWSILAGSLLMLIITIWCYARQPDSLAAFTVLPFWFWGGIGLVASLFASCLLRSRLSLIAAALWIATSLIFMDEAHALWNFRHDKIFIARQASPDGAQAIRIATINCASFNFGDPTADIKKWDPDIVILQQVYPHLVKKIAQDLYGNDGNSRAFITNGIVTRFQIRREIVSLPTRSQQATIRLPNGRDIELVNVHLATAATDLRLWSVNSRATHQINRDLREGELAGILQTLRKTSAFPNTPTIFGGDFNAGATDSVHRLLIPDFKDAFTEVGRGWGDTFHRRFPILRIDHIYATPQFQPIACGTAVSKMTDHRMVIADLLLKK